MGRRQIWEPEELWRQYGNKAAILSQTVTSLVPRSPSTADCKYCKARNCIACGGEQFLLRPEDSSDYRNLLNNCYVVVSDDAPPFGHYRPESRWHLHELVWKTVEMIIYEQRAKDQNVLCYDYDKYNHSSTIISLLTSSTWIHLSGRVGDAVMFYLLKWTSVFLPLPCKKYHQVTGFPMSELVFMFPKHGQEQEGSLKKRKHVDIISRSTKPKLDASVADANSSCFRCFGCAKRSYSTTSSWPRDEYPMKTTLHGGETEAIVAYANNENEGTSIGESPARPTLSMPSKRKHSKPFKWQRQKKRRLLSSEEAYNICSEVKSPSNKDTRGKRSRHYRWNRNKKRISSSSSQEACNPFQCAQLSEDSDLLTDHRKVPCSCCSVFETMHKVSGSI